MRKIFLSLAAVGAALAVASPASAQYYPRPPVPAPGYGYGYGFGQVRALQVRIDNVERQINRLDRRDRIGERSADRLRDEANDLERRLHRRARGGLDRNEAGELTYRVQRLEQRVQYAMNNNRWDRRDRDHDSWDRRDRD